MIKKQWYTFQSFVYFNNLIKQTQSKNRASNSLFSFLCISDIFMEFFSCGLQKFNFNVWTTQFLYWVYFNQVCKYEFENSTTGWVIFSRKQILLGPAWHWRISLLVIVNKLLKIKFVDITQQYFALLPQVNFPANNLNFHWRWWDQIQAIFLNLFYFKYEL